jgi:hypothetical protein
VFVTSLHEPLLVPHCSLCVYLIVRLHSKLFADVQMSESKKKPQTAKSAKPQICASAAARQPVDQVGVSHIGPSACLSVRGQTAPAAKHMKLEARLLPTSPSPIVAQHITEPVILKMLNFLEPHELCNLARASHKLASWSRLPKLEEFWAFW